MDEVVGVCLLRCGKIRNRWRAQGPCFGRCERPRKANLSAHKTQPIGSGESMPGSGRKCGSADGKRRMFSRSSYVSCLVFFQAQTKVSGLGILRLGGNPCSCTKDMQLHNRYASLSSLNRIERRILELLLRAWPPVENPQSTFYFIIGPHDSQER